MGSHDRSVAEEAPVKNYFDDSGVIAENVLHFLGVRSLVNFEATIKFHRIAMMGEIERRR